MPSVYKGEVEVENNDFTMSFERFIVRENEVAFQGSGEDEDKFTFEGKGEKNNQGQYRAEIELEYPGWRKHQAYQGKQTWKEHVAIVIEELVETPKNRKCAVAGYWLQDDDKWSFHGNLNAIKT